MKIPSEILHRIPAPYYGRDGNTPLKPSTGNRERTTSPDNRRNDTIREPVLHRDTEVRLTEAISITQMAQHIINRAMAISMKLKNLAMEAMVSGGVSYEDVAEVGTALRSSLGEYADRYPVTVSIPPVDVPENRYQNENNMYAGRTDIKGELERVQRIEIAFQSNRKPERDDIDLLGKKLEHHKKHIDAELLTLTREGTSLLDVYKTTVSEKNAFRTTDETVNMIADNSAGALKAQGNVSRENILRMRDR